jgi:hypothetical protein
LTLLKLSRAILGLATLAVAGVGPALEAAGAEPLDPQTKTRIERFEQGPATIDVSKYPREMQQNYETFSQKCSQCHKLSAKLDILSCRNLLIYLTPELQKKLFPLFHYSLNPGGVLFLGGAESIGSFASLFAPLAAKARLFRRNESPLRAEGIEFPREGAGTGPGGEIARQPPSTG